MIPLDLEPFSVCTNSRLVAAIAEYKDHLPPPILSPDEAWSGALKTVGLKTLEDLNAMFSDPPEADRLFDLILIENEEDAQIAGILEITKDWNPDSLKEDY